MFGIIRMASRRTGIGRRGMRRSVLMLEPEAGLRPAVTADPAGPTVPTLLGRPGLAPVRRQVRVVMRHG